VPQGDALFPESGLGGVEVRSSEVLLGQPEGPTHQASQIGEGEIEISLELYLTLDAGADKGIHCR
jgi:hypothetical protein